MDNLTYTNANKKKPWTSKVWLYKKYIVERLTEEEIAKAAGTTQATINRWLKKHNLVRKKS